MTLGAEGRLKMIKNEYRRRDIIAEIGGDRIFVVVDATKFHLYYELLEMDKNGNDLQKCYRMEKNLVHRDFVRVGTWRKKIWNLNSW